jgi:hypothetical protein
MSLDPSGEFYPGSAVVEVLACSRHRGRPGALSRPSEPTGRPAEYGRGTHVCPVERRPPRRRRSRARQAPAGALTPTSGDPTPCVAAAGALSPATRRTSHRWVARGAQPWMRSAPAGPQPRNPASHRRLRLGTALGSRRPRATRSLRPGTRRRGRARRHGAPGSARRDPCARRTLLSRPRGSSSVELPGESILSRLRGGEPRRTDLPELPQLTSLQIAASITATTVDLTPLRGASPPSERSSAHGEHAMIDLRPNERE